MKAIPKFTPGRIAKPRIIDTSARARMVDGEVMRGALKARRAGLSSGLDLFSVREAMSQLLSSSGGRPGIEGATAQAKIPRIEKDWVKLEKLTRASANLPHRPSITQTAAMVLHVALSRLSDEEIEAELRKAFG